MYRSARLELRLTQRDLAVLDAKRGAVNRSEYVRWLIHHGAQERPKRLDQGVRFNDQVVPPASDE